MAEMAVPTAASAAVINAAKAALYVDTLLLLDLMVW
jgi:hypothetical protein